MAGIDQRDVIRVDDSMRRLRLELEGEFPSCDWHGDIPPAASSRRHVGCPLSLGNLIQGLQGLQGLQGPAGNAGPSGPQGPSSDQYDSQHAWAQTFTESQPPYQVPVTINIPLGQRLTITDASSPAIENCTISGTSGGSLVQYFLDEGQTLSLAVKRWYLDGDGSASLVCTDLNSRAWTHPVTLSGFLTTA